MRKSVFNPEYQNQDTPAKIVAGLERLAEVFRVLLWDRAKLHGLSPMQIQLLIFLSYHPEPLRNVSHLAMEFNVSKPTISEAVRILDRKGLIQKHPSVSDGRAYSISLTPQGKQRVTETEQFAEALRVKIEKLPEEDVEHLHASLVRIIFWLNREGVIQVQRTCPGCRYYEKKGKHHFCRFLQTDLLDKDLRIDCPEFEANG